MTMYFPEIYPDELLYSWLARYYIQTGYVRYAFVAEELFQSKTVRPDIEFVNQYTASMLQAITEKMPMSEIIENHTMFPYYGRFLPKERKNQAYTAMIQTKGNYHNLPDEWCDFIEKYKYFSTEDTLYIECTIDDPSITDENCCMYELCQTVMPDDQKLKEHPEVLLHDFEGGKYAVYHFKGVPQLLFMVYQEIFCRYLT